MSENEPAQRRLRAAIESSPSGLLMTDPEGRIVLVNREVERLFGYAREELLGRQVEMLVPERFRAEHGGLRHGFVAQPEVRAMGAGRDLFGLRHDGTEVPVEIGLTPVPSEDGLYVLASVVDIGARKRAEERFRAAVESSPAGMIAVDGRGEIVLVNREVERLFGYRREELLGEPVEMLVPERFRGAHPGFRKQFGRHPEKRGMGAGRDLFGLRKDGSEVPVEIGLNPIETDGEMLVLSSVVDISARKAAEEERQRLEEELRQAQKLEAVGVIAGGIAHDFNNLLGAIVGYGELLRDGVREGAPSVDDVEEILNAAHRGRDLVKRLLGFSRRQERERRPLELGRNVEEVVELLRAVLPAAVAVTVRHPDEVPAVIADPVSINQIVMNLATNAAHAMPVGGDLEIVLRSAYVRDSVARTHPDLREGDYVVLEVSDTGTGIDPTLQERIFEPFFTTKEAGSGSGLGLAMVQRIMREHDGGVLLDSQPGEGTQVRCYFPVSEALVSAPSAVEAASDAQQGEGERVLYVDDEPTLCEVARRKLTKLGYEVAVETDPVRALELVRRDPEAFDLVVTDHSMPALNGLDLSREILRLRPELPVVLTSGHVEEVEEKARRAGIREFLPKPATEAEMSRAMRRALEAERDT